LQGARQKGLGEFLRALSIDTHACRRRRVNVHGQGEEKMGALKAVSTAAIAYNRQGYDSGKLRRVSHGPAPG